MRNQMQMSVKEKAHKVRGRYIVRATRLVIEQKCEFGRKALGCQVSILIFVGVDLQTTINGIFSSAEEACAQTKRETCTVGDAVAALVHAFSHRVRPRVVARSFFNVKVKSANKGKVSPRRNKEKVSHRRRLVEGGRLRTQQPDKPAADYCVKPNFVQVAPKEIAQCLRRSFSITLK